MSRKSVILEAAGCLGTNDRIVEFAAVGMKDEKKKWRMEQTNSDPNIVQADLYKPEVKPSGLGALFGFSLWRTAVISSASGTDNINWPTGSEQRNGVRDWNQPTEEIIPI
ncbi:unnamed protein product [Brassica oleracea var. botrytis]